MTKQTRSINKTMEVLTGAYTMSNGEINKDYLCDTLQDVIMNNADLYNLLKSRRNKITSIIWRAFMDQTQCQLNWNYNNQFLVDSNHLKKYINNDYSVFAELVEYLENERKEILEG